MWSFFQNVSENKILFSVCKQEKKLLIWKTYFLWPNGENLQDYKLLPPPPKKRKEKIPLMVGNGCLEVIFVESHDWLCNVGMQRLSTFILKTLAPY